MSRTSELLKQKEKERGQTASLTVHTGKTGGGTSPTGGSRTQRLLTEKGLAQLYLYETEWERYSSKISGLFRGDRKYD